MSAAAAMRLTQFHGEPEADEHEPVPHGEAGGAEDALRDGDLTDFALGAFPPVAYAPWCRP
jgi:hypothetical protein